MTSLLRTIISAAWRRRALILAPFLFLTVASVAAAMFLPKTYESTALILLQEQGGSNPLERADERILDVRSRVAAIEALLKSDRVLSDVVERIYGVVAATDPVATDVELESLRTRLSIEIIGDHFVQISLRGSTPTAVRDELNAVVERLFELLLLPSTATLSATDFLVERQREFVAALEAELIGVNAVAGDLSLAAFNAKLAARDAAARDARAAISTAAQAIAAYRTAAVEIIGPGPAPAGVDEEIGKLRGALEGADAARQGEIEAQIAAFEDLRPTERIARDAQRAAEAARARLEQSERELASHSAFVDRRATIEAKLAAAQVALAGYQERFSSQREKTLIILDAPEELKVVDEPQIPERAATSALILIIAGVAGGLALGSGLAVVAEQLDDSVRGEEDLAATLELPILARLPRLDMAEKETLAAYGGEGVAEASADAAMASQPHAPPPRPTAIAG